MRPLLIGSLAIAAVLAALFSLPTPPMAIDGGGLIRNALVFDGTSFRQGLDVRWSEGRIVEVAPDLIALPGEPVVDAAGRTLLPGLTDTHSHVFGDAANRALDFGVTTLIDLFSDASSLAEDRRHRESLERTRQADVFSAGTLVTTPGGHGTEYGLEIPVLESADQAEAFVAARLAEGSDLIKIVHDDGALYGYDWPVLGPDALSAVVDAAHARGVIAVAHVSTRQRAMEALAAGVDGLVHLMADSPADPVLVEALISSGAFVVPTLAVLESVRGEAGKWLDDDLREGLDAVVLDQLTRGFPGRPELPDPAVSIRRLAQAGVTLLAGADAPNPGTAHGISLHRELELLVNGGLDAAGALAAATSVPARVLELEGRGCIAHGCRADLLLVDGDPREDIRSTREIVGVWKNGFRVDATEPSAGSRELARILAPGTLAAFRTGLDDAVGVGWQVTTDSIRGGDSAAELVWLDSGAGAEGGALSIRGVVRPGFAFPWAGAVLFPLDRPMQPFRLDSGSTLSLQVRGDGGRYTLMFLPADGGIPLRYDFGTTADWQHLVVPLAEVSGLEGRDLAGVVVGAGPAPGRFELAIDEVVVR